MQYIAIAGEATATAIYCYWWFPNTPKWQVTNHFDITLKDGRTIETDGRQTAISELRDRQWLIVHEHVSVPLPPL